MKLHFDQLFTLGNNEIFPKSDITSAGILYKKGIGFPDATTLFGISYATLLHHNFEVEGVSETGYEIKAYYVR